MATGADRVFAIAELLEDILLKAKLETKELFRLQAVNWSFHHAINGSTPLLRIMEVLHKPVNQTRYRVSNPILWLEQLELRVKRWKVEVLSPASPRNAGSGWKVNVPVFMNLDVNSWLSEGKPIGVMSKTFDRPLDGSWRRMKVTRFPLVIEVPVQIVYADVSYVETKCDPTGQMTLGDVVQYIENVRRRSDENHRAQAAAFRAREGEHAKVDRSADCRPS